MSDQRHIHLSILGLTEEIFTAKNLNDDGTVRTPEQEIRSAYRKKILIYHPDKNPDKNCEEIFKKIVKAYEYLMNLRTFHPTYTDKTFKPGNFEKTTDTSSYRDWFYHSPAFRISVHTAFVAKQCYASIDDESSSFGVLHLKDAHLTQIPKAVGMLTRNNVDCITSIDVSNNIIFKLPGWIFTKYRNLREINVSGNFLRKFPTEMEEAKNLTRVEAFDNQDDLYQDEVYLKLERRGIVARKFVT